MMAEFDDFYNQLAGDSEPHYRWLVDNYGNDIDPIKLAEELFKNSCSEAQETEAAASQAVSTSTPETVSRPSLAPVVALQADVPQAEASQRDGSHAGPQALQEEDKQPESSQKQKKGT